MWQSRVALRALLVSPLFLAVAARSEIVLKFTQDFGEVRSIQSVQLAGQVILAHSPTLVSPPPGPQTLVAKKPKDATSARLSNRWSWPDKHLGHGTMSVSWLDARGVVSKVAIYDCGMATFEGYTSTGIEETVTITCATLRFHRIEPTPTPTQTPAPPARKEMRRQVK